MVLRKDAEPLTSWTCERELPFNILPVVKHGPNSIKKQRQWGQAGHDVRLQDIGKVGEQQGGRLEGTENSQHTPSSLNNHKLMRSQGAEFLLIFPSPALSQEQGRIPLHSYSEHRTHKNLCSNPSSLTVSLSEELLLQITPTGWLVLLKVLLSF